MSNLQRAAVLTSFILSLLLISAGPGQAGDYTPPPGVLGPEEVDFGGETVTVIIQSSVHEGNPYLSFEAGGLRYGRLDEAKEKFNVEFDYLTVGTVEYEETLMSRILAGDSIRDLLWFEDRLGYWSFIREGFLYPVDEFLPQAYYEDYLNHQDQIAMHELAHRGTRYGFGAQTDPELFRSIFDVVVSHGNKRFLIYNKSILEREGLPDIQDLYWDDEWNWDSFEEIARATTRDTTGDGEIDQWGITGGWWNHVKSFIASNDGRTIREDEDGNKVVAFDEPAALEAMNKYGEWAQDGLMRDHGSARDGLLDGTGLMGFTYGAYIHDTDDELRYAPAPKGPRADEHVILVPSLIQMTVAMNAENPEGLVALHDFLWRADDPHYDPEGYIEQWIGTRKCLDIITELQLGWQGHSEGPRRTEFDGFFQQAVREVKREGASAERAVNEVKPEAQAWLDDMFN